MADKEGSIVKGFLKEMFSPPIDCKNNLAEGQPSCQ